MHKTPARHRPRVVQNVSRERALHTDESRLYTVLGEEFEAHRTAETRSSNSVQAITYNVLGRARRIPRMDALTLLEAHQDPDAIAECRKQLQTDPEQHRRERIFWRMR